MSFLLGVKFWTLVGIGVLTLVLELAVYRKVKRLMTTEAQLQASLDAIKTGVAALAAALATDTQAIADLKAQIAAGTPVTQEQLDALGTEAQSIADTLNAALNPTPAPIVSPAPPIIPDPTPAATTEPPAAPAEAAPAPAATTDAAPAADAGAGLPADVHPQTGLSS